MFAHYSPRLQLALAALCAIVYMALSNSAAAQTAVSCPTGIGAGATCTCSGGTLTIVEPPNPNFTVNNASICAIPTPTTQSMIPQQPERSEQDIRAEEIEQDLRRLARQRAVDKFIRDNGGDLWKLFDRQDELEDAEKNAEPSEEDRNELLADYQKQLASRIRFLADQEASLPKLDEQINKMSDTIKALTQAHQEAEDRVTQVEANKLKAENNLAAAQQALDGFSVDGDLDETRAEAQNAQTEVEKWQRIADRFSFSGRFMGTLNSDDAQVVANEGITKKAAENYLAAALLKKQLADDAYDRATAAQPEAAEQLKKLEASVTTATQAVSDVTEQLTDAKSTANEVEEDISYERRERSKLIKQIPSTRMRIERLKSEIADLRSKIATLRAKNQFAGPSAGPFDALRARGVEFFGSTGLTKSTDKQLGRNVEEDSTQASVGVQARLSERLIAGVGVNYAYADSDDRTGLGISSTSNTYGLAPFVAYRLNENLALSGSLYYGYTSIDSTRAGIASAEYGSHTYGGGIGLSSQKQLNQWITLTGSAYQSYFRSSTDGYTDSTGLAISGSNSGSGTSSLSGRMDLFPADGWRVFGGTSINYLTINPSVNIDRLDASVTGGVERNWGNASVLAQVNHLAFRNNLDSTGVSLQLRVPW